MAISTFDELRDRAVAAGPRSLVLAGATSRSALAACAAAAGAGLARVHLVGPADEVRARIDEDVLDALSDASIHNVADDETAARVAVGLVAEGAGDVLLKGALRTDQLLRAVLDRTAGLRQGLLSDVLLYEDRFAGACRLVGITDGGINVQPSLAELRDILCNGVSVMQALGVARPHVALLSATEAVTEAVPSSVTARELAKAAQRGELGECEVAGPLALDNALLESAARAKGITTPVAGYADLMVVPNIEAGNILGKAVKYFYGSVTAHVVVGARAPVLIPSRVESAEDKLASIALGVLACTATVPG
ncbi:MAG TPA: phosphate acyltransferase [Longimicrobiales bacterium]|nr:phosphate acyltransferase [Longimicrobiales bacterium]